MTRSVRRLRWLAVASVTAVGMLAFSMGGLVCGCGHDDGSDTESGDPSAHTTESDNPSVPPAVVEPVPSRWAIHEWGLIDVAPTGELVEVAAGPGAPARPDAHGPHDVRPNLNMHAVPTITTMAASVRKPVVYAHLLDGTESITFSLGARVPGGRVVEHWPVGAFADGAVTWNGVVARGGNCAGSAYPSAVGTECADLDYCEAAELARYETSDGACLYVGGAAFDHLFYRGTADALALPLVVTRDAQNGSEMKVSWRGTSSPVETLWRVTRDRDVARIARMPVPTANVELDLVDTSASASDAENIEATEARADVGRALRTQGLTEAEAAAFETAWMSQLFDGPGPIRDAVLYFVPQDQMNTFAELTITPPPTELHRVLMVRVDLTTPRR